MSGWYADPEREANDVADHVVRSGRPVRAEVARLTGGDLADTRVDASAQAASALRAHGAAAATVDGRVLLGPRAAGSAWVLAHELTHVAQVRRQPSLRRAVLPLTEEQLAARARYPTAEERAKVQEVLNPQQAAAEATGGTVDLVTDPAGFTAAMKARLDPYISLVLAAAREREVSTVAIGLAQLHGLADVAEREVRAFYNAYLTAARHTPEETVARAGFRLRDHIHLVNTTLTAETDEVARAWVASRMLLRGSDLLDAFHVLGGVGERDRALFEHTRDEILADRLADLRVIIRFHPGRESGGESFIQGKVAPQAGESGSDTRRRGRWEALETTVHEMLHAVAHERFRDGVADLEASGIAVEGFAEYFKRPVYRSLAGRAATDATLRASIEGLAAPYDSALVPSGEGGYDNYVAGVISIRDALAGGDDNLKVAYFLGRLEFIGLGGWNAAEADRLRRLRAPANVLGAGFALVSTTPDASGLLTLRYGRVVLGRGGPWQLRLGGTVGYLTQGQQLVAGPDLSVQYSGNTLFVRGGAALTGGATPGRSFAATARLDLVPELAFGVRIGVLRLEAGGLLLVPLATGTISDDAVRLGARLGLSLEF